MPRNYKETVRALRAKAADPVVPEPEREALLAKAKEIEDKHVPVKQRPAESTITDRSGQTGAQPHPMTHEEFIRTMNDIFRTDRQSYYDRVRRQAEAAQRYEDAIRQTKDLYKRQHTWNKQPDEDDLISEDYKTNTAHSFHTTDDEDYGYDEWVKGGYDDADYEN